MKEIGIVLEIMPNDLYKVQTPNGNIFTCYLAGKMRINKIRVLIGDEIEFIRDPYGGKTTNRITKRK